MRHRFATLLIAASLILASDLLHSQPVAAIAITGGTLIDGNGGAAVGSHWPMGSSRDGKSVLILQLNNLTGNDLMIVSLTGEHTPVPFLQSSFNERVGRFSPDGTFVAYASDESSRNEVWIRSFPKPGVKFRVSMTGGTHPEWSEDGSKLYFLSNAPDGTAAMMVSDIRPLTAAKALRYAAGSSRDGPHAVRSLRRWPPFSHQHQRARDGAASHHDRPELGCGTPEVASIWRP